MEVTQVHVSVFQGQGEAEKAATIGVRVDGREIQIPVTREVRAYFAEQFVRTQPTPAQRRKYTTVMNLLRAAYRKGVEDGHRT